MKTRCNMQGMIFGLAAVTAWMAGCQKSDLGSARTSDEQVEQEIRSLNDKEMQLVVKRDFAALERFYPEDFVVTNPFHQFIDKNKVMERFRSGIIKYSRTERKYDAFRVYGDTAVVIGSETVWVMDDANRSDAGKTVHRRYTEVYVRRDGNWQKVVRHSHNIVP